MRAQWPRSGAEHFCNLACRMFETFSYLPPLSDDQIARQVDYIVNNGWTPCLEFSEPEIAYVQSRETGRMGPVSSVSAFAMPITNDQCCFYTMPVAAPSMLPRVRSNPPAIVNPAARYRSSPPAARLPQLTYLIASLFLQNYFDNRYWTMWKLPMFGCTDPVQVRPAAPIAPNQRLKKMLHGCMHSGKATVLDRAHYIPGLQSFPRSLAVVTSSLLFSA